MKRQTCLFIVLIFFWTVFPGGDCRAADDFVVRSQSRNTATTAEAASLRAESGKEDAGGKRWVMAVGVCRFADTRIPRLKYCVADARSIADYFRRDGVAPERIVFLADEDASRQAILSSLAAIAAKMSPDDTLIFFYSSHGAGDQNGTTYFITFDTVLDEMSKTALPMQTLKNVLETIHCRNIVMMVDTCHSGGAKALERPDEKAFDKLVRTADRATRIAILTSSRTHETSVESEKWQHGAFTYYMLDGLAGACDNFPRDGRVSVTELFDYVMVAVPRATERAQHPSGKFSYNWPGKKEKAVKVGRVTGERSNPDPGAKLYSGPASSPMPAGASREPVGGESSGWQNVIK